MNEQGVARLITDWLEAEAPRRANEGVLSSAIARVAVTPQRRKFGGWLARAGVRISPTARLLLLSALLLLGLLGGALMAGALLRDPPVPKSSTQYEAVFVRRDRSTDVLIIGVDSQGRERVITRLPNAWSRYVTPAPAGVISPSGLLAMATVVNGVRWTILDVHQPEETPVLIPGFPAQDTDQLDYSLLGDRTTERDARPWWGPADRLAIYWYERIPMGGNSYGRNYFITFADGRTGEATAVDIPDDLVFLPYWAADGSGVLVDKVPPQVLRPDGTLTPAGDSVPQINCYPASAAGRDLNPPRIAVTCTSPDDALTVITAGDVSFPAATVTDQASGASFVTVGNFAGWLEVDR